MQPDAKAPRRNYFSDYAGNAGFNKAFGEYLGALQKEIVAKYLSPENTMRLHHGQAWQHPANSEVVDGGMKEHSVSTETNFQDIVDHKLELIDECVQHLTEGMHRQFAQMLYSTVHDSCDRTGNVVEAKVMPLENAFIAVMEKVSFSADRHGVVRLPEVHTHPDMAKKMMAAVENAPAEYKQRLEQIKARKSKEAIEREAERKTKFVRYGEE
jgi:hypothetical protein